MKAVDAVRQVMETQNVGSSKLADKMGKTPRLVTDRLSQDNISIPNLNEMLRTLDYKVAIVPDNTELKDGWYVIE